MSVCASDMKCLHVSGTGTLISPTDFTGMLGVIVSERGMVSVFVGAETVTMMPDNVLFIPEGMVLSAFSEGASALTVLTFPEETARDNMERLDRELFEMFLIQSRVRPVLLTQEDDICLRMMEAVRLAEVEYSARDTCWGLAIRAQICRLTALLIRRYAGLSGSGLLFHNVARFSEVFSYIRDHLGEKLSVPRLAELVHLSPDYFTQLLFDVTGKTAMGYLHAVRLNEAMRLMLTTDESITNIACKVGFSGGVYFSRLFREVCGMTPGAFRALAPAATQT